MPRSLPLAMCFLLLACAAGASDAQAAGDQPDRKAKPSAMTNADVVELVKAGLSDAVIVTAIKQAPARSFDLTPAGLIALKKAKVSDKVISAMQHSADQRPAKATAPASGAVLSRARAAELIKRDLRLPASQSVRFGRHIRTARSEPDRSGGFMPKITVCVVNDPGQEYAQRSSELLAWRAKELITLQDVNEQQGNCRYQWVAAQLTDEGRKYLLGQTVRNGVQTFTVKTYDLAFGEITGIQVFEQFKTAKVDYTLEKVNVTPFARHVSPGTVNRTATFTLFDDGWRLKAD